MIDYLKLADKLIDLRIKLMRGVYGQMLQDLKGGDIFILNYLENHEDPVHPKDLSNVMSVSTARITNLLNKLETEGLIQRCADPHDKRQVIVVMTEKGKARNLQTREAFIPSTGAFLELLGPEDAETYVHLQEKFLQIQAANHLNENNPEL